MGYVHRMSRPASHRRKRQTAAEWRAWAQFVFGDAGTLALSDTELQRAVCERAERDREEARREGRIEALMLSPDDARRLASRYLNETPLFTYR